MEEMNRKVKCGLGHEVTMENIDSYILQVLGLRHVWLRLRPLVGTLHGGEDADDGVDVNMEETRSEFTRANENDVKHIVDLLKKTLGHTHQDLFAMNATNPFRKGTGNPLNQVQVMQQNLGVFVQDHLQKNEQQYTTDLGYQP